MDSRLILVDGSSYFFRAFHALPPLTNSKGMPTGAIYGVANMVRKLIKDEQPEHFAVIFDAKGKTFRDEWYQDYKAHRPPMPEDLASQFKPLLEVLDAMGVPLLIVDGVEADDVIGTLAVEAVEAGMSVLISTGDKDMAQLVNDKVTLVNTMSDSLMDREGVINKFGVAPELIIDYLTLVGDSVDNVPGVNKCGPKTAVKWLLEYGSLDAIMAHAHDIGGKIGEYLREALAHLPLSKKLVTIKTDVALDVHASSLHLGEPDKNRLISLTKELEFKSWLKQLLENEPETTAPTHESTAETLDYVCINDLSILDKWIDDIKEAKLVAIDTETTSLSTLDASLVGISLAIKPNHAAYIPLAHHDDGIKQLDKATVLARLKPLIEDESIKKIGQNLKYDVNILKNDGIDMKGIAYDTMLESYVINSSASRHDMDTLALKYLGVNTISYEELVGKGAKQKCFDEVLIQDATRYGAEDADITLKLHQKLYPMMDDALKSVFNEIEMPLLPVLARMEREGVLIDAKVLTEQGERLKKRLCALEDEATSLAGKAFNLNSPKQLQEILFDDLSLPIISKTPTGQPSTAESVLHELSFEYRLPAVILEYRSLSKLVSTYIDALPKRIHPTTGRVHTSYNQAVTATGRLSSSDPNLQNIPVRTEEGRLIRRAFIAPEGHVLIAADYSQIELRIMAHLSEDAQLQKAFANGWDIHQATASEIFGVHLDEVSADQRRKAKAVNFGLIYGMSAFGLARQLGVDRQDAQHYIDRYFERYPGVLEYMERTRKLAHRQGYVETIFGRRLYLPEINTKNQMRQKAAERTAINAPMQGSAADIIKKAMLSVNSWQEKHQSLDMRMIMQVHDELIFEVKESQKQEAATEIKALMEHAVQLSVPLLVSVGMGHHWDEAH